MPEPPTEDLRPETRVAIDAVSSALLRARKGVTDADVSFKEGRDVVTTTDVDVEHEVRGLLEEALGHAVVGEEHGGTAPDDGSAYWLVDPICGTRNYASGTPLYCVNLALVEQGEVGVAVVGDPSTDEILVAERGRGAWGLRGPDRRSLTASDTSSTVVVEDGRSTGNRRERAAQFAANTIRADRWDFRSLGSTLSLPYVAAGRVSAYVVFTITSVHAAAGALLVAEAGATVSDIDGDEWTIGSDSLVASATASLHDELLALMTEAR
jgi:myo-inositol-1(or 4)-monophosphatase